MPSLMNMSYHGTFNKTEKFFEKLLDHVGMGKLDKYGKLGVKYLEQATPKDTGLTSKSWYYIVQYEEDGSIQLIWKNSNIQNGEEIAILLQYGHGTGTGGWVKGVDYINPALQKVFKQIQKDAREEVFGIL